MTISARDGLDAYFTRAVPIVDVARAQRDVQAQERITNAGSFSA